MNSALIQFLGIAVSAATIVNIVATIWLGVTSRRIQKQQAETSASQFRLALFEKRMAVFNSLMKLLVDVVERPVADDYLPQIITMLRETRDYEFLFGDSVKEFIHDVGKRAVELNAAGQLPREQRNSEAEITQPNWFYEQLAEAKKVFLPYMDFREP